MPNWSVYIACSLCNARTKRYSDDSPDIASAEAENEAQRWNWIRLPAAPERKRSEGWLCVGCATELRDLLTRWAP